MVNKLAARQKVIDVARSLVGGHYLWGSAGATPGGQDGSPHRTGRVSMAYPSLHPSSACLNAAECQVKGDYVCAGRYLKAPGGKLVPPTDPELKVYLDTFQAEGWKVYMLGYADDHRSYFLNLTPRKIIGANVAAEYKAGIVWGEDCRWKRHFDCIGFINYVFNQTTHPSAPYPYWSAEIEQWFNATQEVKLGDAPVPGDILFRWYIDPITKDKVWDHIALLSEDGMVVQAEEAVMGVHADNPYPKDGATWKERRRLADQFFP